MKTVTEIAKCFNVSADAIRHYTKLGLLSPQRDSTNGYRRYTIQEERRLSFLLSAKRLGLSLKDIREILDVATTGDSPCPLVRKLIDQRLAAIHEEIREAQKLMARIESASREWQTLDDRASSGEGVCHFIEVWDSVSAIDGPTILEVG